MSENVPKPPAPLQPEQILAWLDYEYEEMIARRDEKIIPVLRAIAEKYQTIDDDEVQGNCAENVRMAEALMKVAESHRVTAKEPFLTGGRGVDGWFGRFRDPLHEALRPVQNLMLAYAEKKLAEERRVREAARRKAEEEAAKAAQEAAQAIKERRSHQETARKLDASEDALDAARRAASRADVTAAEQTRVRGVYGATAGLRTSWKWEVSDMAKVPRQYLMVNPEAIRAVAKGARDPSGKPIASIPGIVWVEDHKMGVR